MPAVPDLPAERGPEQQAGPLNPEWRNDCPGRLSASWGHHRPHRRYGSGYPLVLLIVVRLNYMSALHFSSISFAAHKKHGGLWDPTGRAQGFLPNRPRAWPAFVLLLRSCGRTPACAAERFGRKPCARPAATMGPTHQLEMLRIQSWKGLNCTLLGWARFPMGTLLGRTLI